MEISDQDVENMLTFFDQLETESISHLEESNWSGWKENQNLVSNLTILSFFELEGSTKNVRFSLTEILHHPIDHVDVSFESRDTS